ncbi:MAG: helicase-associated domain-containing protein [Sporomusaceae bacterium]|nr:helicase-associated domain-containing protein [Sporomusaceae bacterium]
MSVVLSRKLPLVLNKTYTLEELHVLSKTVLNKMCWRFDVSGWVGNVPNLLRDAIANIPRFLGLYHVLSPEQQAVLCFLCEYAGRPVAVDDVYKNFFNKIAAKTLHTTINHLVQEGWLLEGDNPHTVLVISELKMTLKAVPAFNRFLKAELPREHRTEVPNGQFFSDLIEMAAFLYVEKPKLTMKNYLPKTILRRLASRLSDTATAEWEDAAAENLYTNKMLMLFRGLQLIHALEVVSDQIDNRYYEFDAEKWDDFIFSLPAHRLLAALSWEFSRMNSLKKGSLPFVASLFKNGLQAEGRWQTGAYLMMTSAVLESTVVFVHRDPFRSEDWLETVVLEPLMYLGLFEKTSETLETPWLNEAQKVRTFWRLAPLGIALGEWLTEQGDASAAMSMISKADIHSKSLLSDFSSLFEKWQNILPAEIEQQLIIQPDLSFFVPRYAPPYLLWILSVFGTTEMNEYIYQGSFTRESVLRALKGGVAVGELFEVIEDHSKVPPADNVIRALKQWCAAYDRTILAKAAVLACDTPEMATEILAQSKLAELIIGQIGPRTLVIKPEGEAMIRKWLEKKNWVPRPGIATGQVLHKWLNNKDSR